MPELDRSVSVVIPTFNGSALLGKALESVFSQTLKPVEIIVVDDCSTDDTCAFVSAAAVNAPLPLRLVRLPRNTGGPSQPLNAGIDAARGRLIATLDHDDAMTPNRLQDQVDASLACPDAGMVLGRLRGSGGTRTGLAENGWAVLSRLPSTEVKPGIFLVSAADAYRALLTDGCYAMTCSTFLFPKAVWQRVGGFHAGIQTACDYSFLRAATRHHDLVFVTTVVAEWSHRSDSFFNTAGLAKRVADTWIILQDFKTDDLPAELQAEWTTVTRRVLMEDSYQLRQAGLYSEAFQHCLRSARWCTVDGPLVLAATKVVAAAFMARAGLRRPA